MSFLKGLGSKNLVILVALLFVMQVAYIFILKSENKNLKIEKLELETKVLTLDSSLKKQNEKIKELELKAKKPPAKTNEEKRVEKIYLKDKTCETELLAYKALFEYEEIKKGKK